jgi:hypothetical protein
VVRLHPDVHHEGVVVADGQLQDPLAADLEPLIADLYSATFGLGTSATAICRLVYRAWLRQTVAALVSRSASAAHRERSCVRRWRSTLRRER